MKQVILAIAAVAITGAASPQHRSQHHGPILPYHVDEIRADCPLTITFGSYAMGIDNKAYHDVWLLLGRDRGIAMIELRKWGREGERTLCAVTVTPADARRLYPRIKKRFPRKPRGPLTVSLRGGPEYHSPEPR